MFPQLRYRLIVVTHGAAPQLDLVLASFQKHVSPPPAESVLVVDGPGRVPLACTGVEWDVWRSVDQRGFCGTYQRVWAAARATSLDYVFLLENDFVFFRPVDVRMLAALLIHDPKLAQVALTRNPVNQQEKEAGGLVAARPGQFTPRTLSTVKAQHSYLEHRSFFTSNPCVFRSRLAHEHEWPEGPQCEGIYGIGLRDAGYSFALWGSGEHWVEHVGTRTGKGY